MDLGERVDHSRRERGTRKASGGDIIVAQDPSDGRSIGETILGGNIATGVRGGNRKRALTSVTSGLKSGHVPLGPLDAGWITPG